MKNFKDFWLESHLDNYLSHLKMQRKARRDEKKRQQYLAKKAKAELDARKRAADQLKISIGKSAEKSGEPDCSHKNRSNCPTHIQKDIDSWMKSVDGLEKDLKKLELAKQKYTKIMDKIAQKTKSKKEESPDEKSGDGKSEKPKPEKGKEDIASPEQSGDRDRPSEDDRNPKQPNDRKNINSGRKSVE